MNSMFISLFIAEQTEQGFVGNYSALNELDTARRARQLEISTVDAEACINPIYVTPEGCVVDYLEVTRLLDRDVYRELLGQSYNI